MLIELPIFAHLLLAYARSAAIDPETRSILQATIEGNPPSVWSQADCGLRARRVPVGALTDLAKKESGTK